MSDFIRVDSTERERIDADPSNRKTVKNLGPDSCYYGGENVSSVSNTGTLTMGSSLTLPPGYWFRSAGRSRLFVQSAPEVSGGNVLYFGPNDTVVLEYGQFGFKNNGDGTLSIYYGDGS